MVWKWKSQLVSRSDAIGSADIIYRL